MTSLTCRIAGCQISERQINDVTVFIIKGNCNANIKNSCMLEINSSSCIHEGKIVLDFYVKGLLQCKNQKLFFELN